MDEKKKDLISRFKEIQVGDRISLIQYLDIQKKIVKTKVTGYTLEINLNETPHIILSSKDPSTQTPWHKLSSDNRYDIPKRDSKFYLSAFDDYINLDKIKK